MAKREFIHKNNFWIDLQVQTPISIAMERNTITEQEIVKPYLEKLKAEISKSKTEHEMQIAARDTKAKLLISHIYCDIVNILDKCKAEREG